LLQKPDHSKQHARENCIKPLADRGITIYCGFLLALGAFSIDITLPFFDRIRDTLSATASQTHGVVLVYIFMLGIGQLVFGPLSDRIGRRITIAIGLSIYALGAIFALLATQIEMLLVGRALQGFGGAVAPVAARSIIRDRFSGKDLARNMALASGIFAIGPIIAPLIGAILVEIGGNWRVVFGAMTLLSAAMLVTLLWIPETLREKRRDATSPSAWLRNSRAILGHPQSRFYLILTSWAMLAILIILSGMPAVMETEFGVTGTLFAILFAIHGLGIILGQIVNHWLIDKIGVVPSMIFSASIMVLTFIGLSIGSFAGWMTPYLLATMFFFFAVGHLCVFANAILAMVIMYFVGDSLLRWSMILLFISIGTLVSLLVWKNNPKYQAVATIH